MTFEDILIDMLKNKAFLALAGLALIIYLLYLISMNKIDISAYIKSYSRPPFKYAWSMEKTHGIFFGKKGLRFVYSPQDDEGHVGVFGGSGTGKTQAIILNTLSTWQGNGLYLDISGDIRPNVNMPRQIDFCPTTTQKMRYDPFALIGKLSDRTEIESQLSDLAEDCIPVLSNMDETHQYFARGAQTMLKAALLAFYPMDFIGICEVISKSSYVALFSLIDQQGDPTASALLTAFQDESEKNVGGCFRNLKDFIDPFVTDHRIRSHVGRAAEGEVSIDASCVLTHNLFVCIDDAKLDHFAPLVKLMTIQAFSAISMRENGAGPKILICLDEFASLGAISIMGPIEKSRKKNCRILLAMQSVGSLENVYGEIGKRNILNNLAFKVILGASDPYDQKYFADMIGREEKMQVSKTDGEHSSTTTSYHEEYSVPPSSLDDLGNKLIVKYKGGYAKLKKVFYHKIKRKGGDC